MIGRFVRGERRFLLGGFLADGPLVFGWRVDVDADRLVDGSVELWRRFWGGG